LHVGAAVVEEAIKYLALRLAVRRARPKQEKEYRIYVAVVGLDYATIENILVIYTSIQNKETGGMVTLTLLERIVLASMGHTIMALLTDLQSTRRDARAEKLSIWQVITRAVAYHGTWDCVLFAVSAWNGNVGCIHPNDAGSIAVALFSVLAFRSKAALDFTRQLRAMRLKACTS
jgi:RsiW-degrading membrane proteinase PrsW (M82 family)